MRGPIDDLNVNFGAISGVCTSSRGEYAQCAGLLGNFIVSFPKTLNF
jgi:hypothetical protein